MNALTKIRRLIVVAAAAMIAPVCLASFGDDFDLILNYVAYKVDNNTQTAAVVYRDYSRDEDYLYGRIQLPNEIVIPDTVYYLGKAYAVTSVEAKAFDCNNIFIWYLDHVTLPHTLQSIGEAAFRKQWNMDVDFPAENNIGRVDADAFTGTAWFQAQPDGLIYIGHVAYQWKGDMAPQTTVALRESTTSVTAGLFNGQDNLKGIVVPKSLTTNQSWTSVVTECRSLSKIAVEAENPTIDSRDNCNAIIETATDKLLLGCNGTKIPGSVKVIGVDAFQNMSGVPTLRFPDSVTELQYGAISNTRGLNTLIFGKGLAKLAQNAINCYSLKSIYLSSRRPPTAVTNSLYVDYDNCVLYVPEGSEEIYWANTIWNRFVTIRTWNPDAENDETTPGDINVDGAVDVEDLNLMVNHMLGNTSLSDLTLADFDGNGTIDIDDINAIINVMLGKGNAPVDE